MYYTKHVCRKTQTIEIFNERLYCLAAFVSRGLSKSVFESKRAKWKTVSDPLVIFHHQPKAGVMKEKRVQRYWFKTLLKEKGMTQFQSILQPRDKFVGIMTSPHRWT